MTKNIFAVFGLLFTYGALAASASIGTDKAQSYQVAAEETMRDGSDEYLYVCAATKAASKEERAQTMVKAILKVTKKVPDTKVILYLAPHGKLCQVGRLIGTAYYSPSGEGWKGIASGTWTWYLLTTGSKVTQQQIADTIIYEDNKAEFKQEYGDFDYSEKLDDFVTEKLGRKPKYVTSGMWVDTFLVE